MLYKETVPEKTLDLILRLMKDEMLKEFGLFGDTALSLQIGHCLSTDIDLFNKSSFDAVLLSDHLAEKYKAASSKTQKNDLSCIMEAVKVELLSYPYPLIQPLILMEGMRMGSLEDLGAMKLKAIVDDGGRFKDFVDIYKILEHEPLESLTDAYEKKYPKAKRAMVYKGLVVHNELVPASVNFIGEGITVKDIAYRFKKAVQEPKRIFESVPWQRKTFKKQREDKPPPDKSRGKGLHQ
jgi:hypothetical protein